jgi:hypothetical protein
MVEVYKINLPEANIYRFISDMNSIKSYKRMRKELMLEFIRIKLGNRKYKQALENPIKYKNNILQILNR